MKKALKILKWGSLSLFILFIVAVIAAGITVKAVVTKDFVATKIEENINGRVEIKDISVPIWAALSGITVEGFKIGNKDAEMQKPMEERTPMQNSVISFESFNFRLALGALITSMGKDLNLTSLVLTKPKAHIVLFKNGGNNLTSLLVKEKTPEELAAEKEAAREEAKEEEKALAEEPPPAKPGQSEPFSIKSINTVIKMGKLGIEQGYFTINIEKLGNTLTASNVRFLLKDVLIDPKDLENKNRIGLSTGVTLALKENAGSAVKSFKIIFDANGQITPFDPKTGRPTQSLTMRLGLLEGTEVTGLAVMNKLKTETAVLKKLGVNLNFLNDNQRLNRDSMATISYNYGKVTFLDPLTLHTPDFTFQLTKDDYLHTTTMDHLLRGDFMLSDKHTASIKNQLKSKVSQGVGPLVSSLPSQFRSKAESAISPDAVTNKILAPAMKDGKISLGVESNGSLTSPNVRITRPDFQSPEDMMKKQMSLSGIDMSAIAAAEAEKLKKQAQEKLKNEANRLKKEGEKKLQEGAAKALRGLF